MTVKARLNYNRFAKSKHPDIEDIHKILTECIRAEQAGELPPERPWPDTSFTEGPASQPPEFAWIRSLAHAH